MKRKREMVKTKTYDDDNNEPPLKIVKLGEAAASVS